MVVETMQKEKLSYSEMATCLKSMITNKLPHGSEFT